eukprot:CAMPEP_0173459334 /NCGR_PEP_ID=MMETSP1357-20121228/61198_1 /TAXON_ID=77926 /ORGANISM="Hemiselmis rufescens, Strain PCC563" /LENGTH=288 /DNA_ID=CAMNT_0014426791 /DNA_START=1 /DNA_END=863 /DNA_ORIENTATION=-
MLGVDGADYMVRQMERNTTITDLRLASNGTGEEGSYFLSQCVGFCQSLRRVDLSCNSFDARAAQELGECITAGGLSSLHTLQLSQNAIGDAGVMRLLVSLGDHRGLTELNLSYCEVSDDGAPSLGALAASLPSLNTLKFNSNRITEDGFKGFCEWLMVSGSRFKGECIEMDGNLVGDSGVPDLVKLVKSSPWLEIVSLRGNFFGAAGVRDMLEMARECQHLRELQLRGNDDIIREGGKKDWEDLNDLLLGRKPQHALVTRFAGQVIKVKLASKTAIERAESFSTVTSG